MLDLNKIEVVTRADGTVEIRDHNPPRQSGGEELAGPALRAGLRAEIEAHVAAIAAEAPERPALDNVRRMLFLWADPADASALSGVLATASYVLAALRQGISTRLAVLTAPQESWAPPARLKAVDAPAGRTGPESALSGSTAGAAQ